MEGKPKSTMSFKHAAQEKCHISNLLHKQTAGFFQFPWFSSFTWSEFSGKEYTCNKSQYYHVRCWHGDRTVFIVKQCWFVHCSDLSSAVIICGIPSLLFLCSVYLLARNTRVASPQQCSWIKFQQKPSCVEFACFWSANLSICLLPPSQYRQKGIKNYQF